MKKQNIKETLDTNYSHTLDGKTLREAASVLIKLADECESRGYSNIAFDLDYCHDHTADLTIVGTRIETDDEAIARAAKEVQNEKETRKRDMIILQAAANRLGIKIENL